MSAKLDTTQVISCIGILRGVPGGGVVMDYGIPNLLNYLNKQGIHTQKQIVDWYVNTGYPNEITEMFHITAGQLLAFIKRNAPEQIKRVCWLQMASECDLNCQICPHDRSWNDGTNTYRSCHARFCAVYGTEMISVRDNNGYECPKGCYPPDSVSFRILSEVV